jgi:FixJ family two-component response regulator
MIREPTVFIIDDNDDFRTTVQQLIESVGLNVETYTSAQELLDSYDNQKPGCLVMDVRMPGMSGLDAQEALAKRGVSTPVIFVSACADVSVAVRAMKCGAANFFEKPFNPHDFLDCVQRCVQQDVVNRHEHTRCQETKARLVRLTSREKEVMRLVVAGMSSKAIAQQLGISRRTVESHRAKVMHKTEAQSIVDLVQLAVLDKMDR